MGFNLPFIEDMSQRDSEMRFRVGHRDGVAWDQRGIPWRWHKCRVDTQIWLELSLKEICRCGATKFDDFKWRNEPWLYKNSRKKGS